MSVVDKLTAHYIALRDRKAQMKKRHEEELAPINEYMQRIEVALLHQLNEAGVNTMASNEGTVYRKERNSFKVVDREALVRYTRDHDLDHLLDIRVNKPGAEEYLKSEGHLPPGVNLSTDVTVGIRRPPKK